MRHHSVLLVGWLLALALAACAPDTRPPTATPLPPATPAPPPTATPAVALIITAPLAGATIDSPLNVRVALAGAPDATLLARVIATTGTVLGTGELQPLSPTEFQASLDFAVPPDPSGTLEVVAFDPHSGQVYAQSSVAVAFAPPPTATPDAAGLVTINEPQPGSTVAPPIVVRGQVQAVPPPGQLDYLLVSGDGQLLASGPVPVEGTPGRPAEFVFMIEIDEAPAGPVELSVRLRGPTAGLILFETRVLFELTTATR